MTTATKKAAAASKYTPEICKAIQDAQPLNLEKATALAETPMFKKAGITARGIGAKCRSEGWDYQSVERKTKDGQPVMDKAEMAADIAKVFGMPEGSLKSLAKAEKADLRALLAAVKAYEPAH